MRVHVAVGRTRLQVSPPGDSCKDSQCPQSQLKPSLPGELPGVGSDGVCGCGRRWGRSPGRGRAGSMAQRLPGGSGRREAHVGTQVEHRACSEDWGVACPVRGAEGPAVASDPQLSPQAVPVRAQAQSLLWSCCHAVRVHVRETRGL